MVLSKTFRNMNSQFVRSQNMPGKLPSKIVLDQKTSSKLDDNIPRNSNKRYMYHSKAYHLGIVDY